MRHAHMKHSERRTRILASLALAASMAFGSSVAHADIAAAEARVITR